MADRSMFRNQILAETMIKNLEKRNMEGYFAKTKEDALRIALELIPEGSSVGWGGSMSVEAIGLLKAVVDGNYKEIDRSKGTTPEEVNHIMRECFFADYFLTSTNAITEDGMLVNIDGRANRVAAISFGPTNVIMVVGMNKVTKNEEEAKLRAQNTAAPINSNRFEGNTPCKKTGSCAMCLTPDTVCCQYLTTRYSKVKGRIKVILVDENLGF